MEFKFLRHFSSEARAHAAALEYKPVRVVWRDLSDVIVPRCNGLCPVGAMIQVDYKREAVVSIIKFKSPQVVSVAHFLRSSCGKNIDEDDCSSMRDFMLKFDHSSDFNYRGVLKGESSVQVC